MGMEDKKPNTHLNNGGEQQPVDPATQQYKTNGKVDQPVEDGSNIEGIDWNGWDEVLANYGKHDDYLFAYDAAKKYDLFFKLPQQYHKPLEDRAIDLLKNKLGIRGRDAYQIFKCFDHYLNNDWNNWHGLSAEDKRQMSVIDNTIDELPKFEGSIHRGLHFKKNSPRSMFSFNDIINKVNSSLSGGSSFELMGFPSPVSFSSNIEVAHKFAKTDENGYINVIFSIKDNKSGASVRFMSMYELEDEVLHKSTQKYKAVSRSFKKNPKTGEDMYFFEIEETED